MINVQSFHRWYHFWILITFCNQKLYFVIFQLFRIIYIQRIGRIQLFNNSTGNVPSIHRYDAYVCICSRFTVASQLILKTTHDAGIYFENILHEFIEIHRNAGKLWKHKIPFLVTKSGWNLESFKIYEICRG